MLEVQLKTKSNKDSSYSMFHKEVTNIGTQLATFCSNSMEMVYSLQEMDKLQAPCFMCSIADA